MPTDYQQLEERIQTASVISFDAFDTLILRRVNAPEDIFAVMEKKLGLAGFASERIRLQAKASEKAERTAHRPHANLDEIYAVMAEESGLKADWDAVKRLEIEAECDAAMPNPCLKPLYEAALKAGKRLIITSDMYLSGDVIRRLLKTCGYPDPHAVYVSSEANACKYNGDLYDYVVRCEKADPSGILHIGDNADTDYAIARASGWQAYLIEPAVLPFEDDLEGEGLFDRAVSRKLAMTNDDFWYRIGVCAGGPLYLGVMQWFRAQMETYPAKHVLLVSRDGWNLSQLLKERGYRDVSYLKMSRRSVLLAGITKFNEEVLNDLPPHSWGQTIRDVLRYLGMEDEPWEHLGEVGFESLDDVIADNEDRFNVRKLYVLNSEIFLKHCGEERRHALAYFENMGLRDDCLLFDCGWNGSSQYLLDRFLKAVGLGGRDRFSYIGILDTPKSRRQLKNKPYETYLFDCNENRAVQDRVKKALAIFELFFGAPEESVWYYDESGPVYEDLGNDEDYKVRILDGIRDFLAETCEFADTYHVNYTTDNAVSGVCRLIAAPTEEEAVRIGDLPNVDGVAVGKGKKVYMARMTLEDYKADINTELYWPQGLIRRPDTDPALKAIIEGKYELNRRNDVSPDQIPLINTAEEPADDRSLTERYGPRCANYLKELRQNREAHLSGYDRWIALNESGAAKTEVRKDSRDSLLFSVVVPVYNVPDGMLTAMTESVLAQTETSYELILVDDCSTWDSVRTCLKACESHPRVSVIYRTENGNISKATNTGIEAAKGEFLVFADCDDILEADAMASFARLLEEKPELDFIYSDEDKLSEDGTRRHSPFFKPDWSPDTFMCLMYTNHLAAYRRSKVIEAGLLRSEYDGTQDYDLTLRFMELTTAEKVGHVPKILYHWRERAGSIASDMRAKPYAVDAMRRMKEDMLKRRGIKGRPVFINDISQYRIVYEAPADAFVSIIIPAMGEPEKLRSCLESIIMNAGDLRYEIIVADGQPSEKTKAATADLPSGIAAAYLPCEETTSFGRLANRGAQAAQGNYYLFMNEAAEVVTRDFLPILTGAASQAHTGAAGAKILTRNSSLIRHIGIVNLPAGTLRAFEDLDDRNLYSFCRNRADYNWLAVSESVLMVARDKFVAAGGFDEDLTVSCFGEDLSFKLYEKGFYNVVRNDAIAYLSENREDPGQEETVEIARIRDRRRLRNRHPAIGKTDPFYNRNLAADKASFEPELPVDKDRLSQIQTGKRPYHDYTAGFNAVFDEIVSDDECVRIKGWYYTGDPIADNESDAEIILMSGRSCLCAAATKTLREDIRDNIDSRAFYTGFTAEIDNAAFESGYSYEIGLHLIRPKEGHLFRQTDQTVTVNDRVCHPAIPVSFKLPPVDGSVHFSLESCETDGGICVLKGWAFTSAVMDHSETAMRLVLVDEEDTVYLAGLKRIESLEVGRASVPHEHLDRCGFTAAVELPDRKIVRTGIWVRDLKTAANHLAWFSGGDADPNKYSDTMTASAGRRSLKERSKAMVKRLGKRFLT